MLNEILRQAYEQGKDIDIYLPKNAPESYMVSAVAFRDAMKYMSSETSVRIMIKDGYPSKNELYNGIASYADSTNDNIAVILGTSSTSSLDMEIKNTSQSENIYAFEYNIPDSNKRDIARKLSIPSNNIFIDENSTSIAQTMAMQLKRANALDGNIATMLIYGILKETDNLRNGSQKTFEIVSMLMQNGGSYEKAFEAANKKMSLEERMAVSELLSSTDIHDIDISGEKRRIAFIQLDKAKVKKLRELGIQDIRGVLKKLQEISDVDMSFAIVQDEDDEKKYKIQFMRNDASKGVDLEALSSKFGRVKSGKFYAESEYVARGVFKGVSQVSKRILEEIEDSYKRESGKVDNTYQEESTKRLSEILRKTAGLSKNVSATDLRDISNLIKNGADTSQMFMEDIPLNIFMLREDLAGRIDRDASKDKVALIRIPRNDAAVLEARYGVSEEEILACVDLFKDTDASEIRIELDTDRGRQINSKFSEKVKKAKKLLNSIISAGRRATKEEVFERKHTVLEIINSRNEKGLRGG